MSRNAKLGGDELHRPPRVLRIKINRVAEQFVAGFFRRKLFAELGPRLRADAKRRARQKTHDAVAARVHEQRRGDFVSGGILRAERADGFDGVRVGLFQVVNGGVEQQRDVRFVDDHFQHDRVEDERVALGIADTCSRRAARQSRRPRAPSGCCCPCARSRRESTAALRSRHCRPAPAGLAPARP